jgi:segregation and condensation protein B
MARPSPELFDAELADLPAEARWREWMGRVEAAIFASPRPVSRETLATLVGRTCVLDEIIADIRDELKGRPYELVAVAGGWQHRTRRRFADAIQRAFGAKDDDRANLTATESLAVTAIAYFQPVTRQKLSQVLGREISRDVMARLKRLDLIGAGPRVAQPGAPLTYVTTTQFLSVFGLNSLRDLPDMEVLEDAGLLATDRDERSVPDPLADLLGLPEE